MAAQERFAFRLVVEQEPDIAAAEEEPRHSATVLPKPKGPASVLPTPKGPGLEGLEQRYTPAVVEPGRALEQGLVAAERQKDQRKPQMPSKPREGEERDSGQLVHSTEKLVVAAPPAAAGVPQIRRMDWRAGSPLPVAAAAVEAEMAAHIAAAAVAHIVAAVVAAASDKGDLAEHTGAVAVLDSRQEAQQNQKDSVRQT